MSSSAQKMPEPSGHRLCWRDFDARRLNKILNDPFVRPWVADAEEGPLDLTPVAENPLNVNMAGDHGFCFFVHLAPGIYEVHTAVLKSGRGAWTFAFAKAVVAWMFTSTDCFEVTTRIPATHDGARMLAVKTGMRHEFTRPDQCKFRDEAMPCDIYSFRLQDWASKCNSYEADGRDFHERLNAKVKELGVTDPPHGDDKQHNAYLGITLAMVRAGQLPKAVQFYNRWAILSRHAPVQLLQINPPAIKFDAGTIIFIGDDFVVKR